MIVNFNAKINANYKNQYGKQAASLYKMPKSYYRKNLSGAHSYINICNLVLKAIKRKKFFIQWFEQKSAQNLQECC